MLRVDSAASLLLTHAAINDTCDLCVFNNYTHAMDVYLHSDSKCNFLYLFSPPLSHTHIHTHTHTHFLSFSHSLLTHAHFPTLSLSLTYMRTHSLTHSLTHTLTLSSLSLSLSLQLACEAQFDSNLSFKAELKKVELVSTKPIGSDHQGQRYWLLQVRSLELVPLPS